MTILETRHLSEEVVLPEGIQIDSEALQTLGSLPLRAGQVLVGRLDQGVIDAYPHGSQESKTIASAIINIPSRLPRELSLIIDRIPGEESSNIGLWVAPYVKERNRSV